MCAGCAGRRNEPGRGFSHTCAVYTVSARKPTIFSEFLRPIVSIVNLFLLEKKIYNKKIKIVYALNEKWQYTVIKVFKEEKRIIGDSIKSNSLVSWICSYTVYIPLLKRTKPLTPCVSPVYDPTPPCTWNFPDFLISKWKCARYIRFYLLREVYLRILYFTIRIEIFRNVCCIWWF